MLDTSSLAILIFLSGTFVSEAITYRIFGKPKKFALLIDIVIFVLVASYIFRSIGFVTIDIWFLATNFFAGVLTIIIIRTIEFPLKLIEKPQASVLMVNIIRGLARSGLEKAEIKNILKSSGFSSGVVDKYGDLIDEHTPRHLVRMIRIEKSLDAINKKIETLIKKKRK